MRKNELNYFDNFIKNSNYSLECVKILKEFINDYNIDKSEIFETKVHDLENEADRNQHIVLNYLIKDFLPPIDREDIVMLCHKIDDVVDNIDEVVTNLNILNVKVLRDDISEFVDLLLECTKTMVKMLEKFKNIKKYDEIKELVISINKLEEHGDSLYQNSIKRLYEKSEKTIDIIVWTTIYNCFEHCFDSCENVADCVEEILMKNS